MNTVDIIKVPLGRPEFVAYSKVPLGTDIVYGTYTFACLKSISEVWEGGVGAPECLPKESQPGQYLQQRNLICLP
ncbi:hypothetical protein FJZ31_08360 [Candidatus Poribacteria bacterium]|nr:hypothetical protein [Candidatus Poribacteria bacterium]